MTVCRVLVAPFDRTLFERARIELAKALAGPRRGVVVEGRERTQDGAGGDLACAQALVEQIQLCFDWLPGPAVALLIEGPTTVIPRGGRCGAGEALLAFDPVTANGSARPMRGEVLMAGATPITLHPLGAAALVILLDPTPRPGWAEMFRFAD